MAFDAAVEHVVTAVALDRKGSKERTPNLNSGQADPK
jgi:hypothetical protein